MNIETVVARIDENVKNLVEDMRGIQEYTVTTSKRVGSLERFQEKVKGVTRGVVITLGSLGTLAGIIVGAIKAFG